MGESMYLDLLSRLLDKGEVRHGRNGTTLSLFGERLEFDLQAGFPLLTTKRVFWRGVAEELFWFLRGSTNANELSEKGVHIWDKNTSREFLDSVGLAHVEAGFIGAGYGHCWKAFGGDYPPTEANKGVDQIRYIIEELTNNPHGRRAILSAWNPTQLHMAALPPCHFVYEFYLSDKHGLSCMMIMRSCDVAAGLPFNIASTALLTSLIAKVIGVQAHRIIINMGDTHLYDQHTTGASEQSVRQPNTPPTLRILRDVPANATIDDKVKWLETLKFEDVAIDEYLCHPPIKYEMIA